MISQQYPIRRKYSWNNAASRASFDKPIGSDDKLMIFENAIPYCSKCLI